MAGQILFSDSPYFFDTKVSKYKDYNLINTLTRGVEGGDSSRARCKLALGCSSLWEEDIMIISTPCVIDLCPVTRVNMYLCRGSLRHERRGDRVLLQPRPCHPGL